MRTLFDASIISLAQVLLLSFCGLGPAQLLLPARLRPHTLTLAPLVGLALLALLGFYATNAGLTLRQILPLALLLALGSLVLAWLRPRGSRWPGRLPARELVPLLLLMLIAWLINLAPVLNYGALTPIGDNWDVEFYLPLADYLKDYSYPTLALAPASPLRNQVMSNPTVARAMGATYAQGLADLLGGWRAWESWVPMLALLRALTLPALYALLREGLGVRVAGALCGCALAAANSLLLWTTYNSFGMSTAGLALLPLALLCTLLALEQGTPRSVGAAALLLGGLSCTYWPCCWPTARRRWALGWRCSWSDGGAAGSRWSGVGRWCWPAAPCWVCSPTSVRRMRSWACSRRRSRRWAGPSSSRRP